MKLVIHPPLDDARLSRVREAAGSATVVNAATPGDVLKEIVDADAFMGKITPPMLQAAKNLRWIQTFTASLEHYIFPKLVQHPVVLSNTRGLFSDIIADHVFGYMLCFSRNLHTYVRLQMKAKWAPVGGEDMIADYAAGPGYVTGVDRAHFRLADASLGIVGLGHIGSEIARRGLAFGMTVRAVDPIQKEAPAGVSDLWGLDRLDELLSISDFVVIAAPHTPDTEGLFRREKFRKMKKTAFFINIGRGAIVSLDDLVAALGSKEIAGAALDVYQIEPLPPEHPLWKMENVILTPHVAACSERLPERHLETLVDNVRRFATGQEVRNVVHKAKWF